MPEEGLPLKEIGSVIPSVYYDLIARVTAGAPFAVVLLDSNHAKLTEMEPMIGKAGILLMLLLGSYLVGMLLTPISSIFELPFMWFSRRALGLQSYSLMKGSYEQTKRMAQVSAADKESGTTENKMAAEAVLFRNLFAGFLILLGLRCVHLVDFPLSPAKYALLLLSLLIALVHRRVVHIGRQKAFYEIWRETHPGLGPEKAIVPEA